MIHVCSLAALPETVRVTGASHVLTVMANVDQVQRPESVLAANHLKVAVDDMTEQLEGFVAPCDSHIEQHITASATTEGCAGAPRPTPRNSSCSDAPILPIAGGCAGH